MAPLVICFDGGSQFFGQIVITSSYVTVMTTPGTSPPAIISPNAAIAVGYQTDYEATQITAAVFAAPAAAAAITTGPGYTGTSMITNVNVENLEVDGNYMSSPGTSAGSWVGIYYQDASGTVSGNLVGWFYNSICPGCQMGWGIAAETTPQTGGAPTTTVTITNNVVQYIQKNGIVCRNIGTTCDITTNTVENPENPSQIAPNGIEIGVDINAPAGPYGATGTISGNVVSGFVCTLPVTCGLTAAMGTGIILYGATSPVTVTGNTVTGSDIGIGLYGDSGTDTVSGNTVTGSTYYGVQVYDQGATLSGNTISSTSPSYVANVWQQTDNLETNNLGSATSTQGTTGITAAITGATPLTTFTLQTETLTTVSHPDTDLANVHYFDVYVNPIAIGGQAMICINDPAADSLTQMWYYNGAAWVQVTPVTLSAGAVCGTVAVSQLGLTNFALGDPLDSAPTISPIAGEFVPGQSVLVTVSFGYDSHTPAADYSTSLYAVPGPSCIGANTGTLVGGPTTGYSPVSFTITNMQPGDIYLCAVTTDSLTTLSYTSGVTSYTVTTPIKSYNTNEQERVSIDLGQSVTLTDYPTGGAAPYSFTWYEPVYEGAIPAGEPHPGVLPTGTCLNTAFPYSVTGYPESATITIPSTYLTASGAGVYRVDVSVTDSSIGTPANSVCEAVDVIVNSVITGSLVVDGTTALEINEQIGSGALQAIVTWSGGTGPWYNVYIVSGSVSTCSDLTNVVAHITDVNGTEAILTFPEPTTSSSTTYYCAKITDSSVGTPATAVYLPSSGLGVQVNTSPALTAPSMVLFNAVTQGPPQNDYGQTAITLGALVTWAGGTAPYYISLWSGSSSNCAAPDNVEVTPVVEPYPYAYTPSLVALTFPGLTPITATTGPSGALAYETTGSAVLFEWTSPAVTTYYCAIAQDSSVPTSTTYTAVGAKFTIEGLFAVNSPSLSSQLTEVLSPSYEGTPVTATVTWSGGTGPFVVSLYIDPVSSACLSSDISYVATEGSNPQTGIMGDSASFTFLAPMSPGTYYICSSVTDINGYTVTNGALPLAPGTELIVSPTLGAVTLTLYSTGPPLGTPGTDNGQSESATAVVSWPASTGSAPYKVTLYSGSSPLSCAADTSVVSVSTGSNPVTGLLTNGATFVFPSPKVTTYYCATVTDSSVPQSVSSTLTPVVWQNVPGPTVALPLSYEIAAGSSTSISAIVLTAGITPDYLQWFVGSTCAPADAITGAPPASVPTYNTGVISTTTTYSVQITDSSGGLPPATNCAAITITTNNGPMSVAVEGSASYAGLGYVTNPVSPGTQTNAGSLTVVDSDSNSVITTIALTGDSGACTLNPAGVTVDSYDNLVYVTGSTSATCLSSPSTGWVAVVNPATNKEIGSYQVGTNPQGIAVDPFMQFGTGTPGYVYIANSGDNTVSVCPLSTISTPVVTCTTTVPVGPNPMDVAVDGSTHTVYVSDYGSNTISVLQPRLNPPPYFVVTTVNVGFEPLGVVVNALNDNVLVANSGSGTVSVLNGFSYGLIATVKVGGMPTGIDINYASATQAYAYVANAATNVVTVINLSTNTPLSPTIAVGGAPSGVAVDAANGTVLVTNSDSNTVSVISLANNQVIATIVVP